MAAAGPCCGGAQRWRSPRVRPSSATAPLAVALALLIAAAEPATGAAAAFQPAALWGAARRFMRPHLGAAAGPARPGPAPRPAPRLRGPVPGVLPPLRQAKAEFEKRFPEYGYSGWLDAHWQGEVGVRMPGGGHYLDFTGSGLYTNAQVAAAAKELEEHVFGNPHCTSPSSLLVDAQMKEARRLVLQHFSADPEEYAVVFTRSATEALKIVGESFPWSPRPGWRPPRRVPPGGVNETDPGHPGRCGRFEPAGNGGGGEEHSTFVYLRANHKSVLGVGALARERGAEIACVDEAGMEAWLSTPPPRADPGGRPSSRQLRSDSHSGGGGGGNGEDGDSDGAGSEGKHGSSVGRGGEDGDDDDVTFSLVAYPAKDNYEGRLYPLEWIDRVRARSTRRHRWLTLVDAAAFVPTHPLNLSEVKPDFVPISFYKMLGSPTGVGALLVRREAGAELHVVYFGGGSVLDATAEGVWRLMMPLPEGLETGTAPFLDIIQLKHGFAVLAALGGMQAIEAHVQALRTWAWEQLSRLRHAGGQPLLRVFGAHERGPGAQSCLFQFLVLRPNGTAHSAVQVQNDASARGLHLRSGCHCNPGQCLFDLGIRPEEERKRALSGDLDKPFITVLRPAPGDDDNSTDAAGDKEAGRHGRVVPMLLPTGSVRASLGSLSTFEDVYALIAFLVETYRE